jgi:thiamine biosynthesis lipoprotein
MKKISKKPPFRFSHFSMGTTFEVIIAGSDEIYAGQASQAVFAEIDRIDNLFNRFNPSSEVGQLNLLKAGKKLKIGIELFECLKTAARVQKETGGAFNINVASLVQYKRKGIEFPVELSLLPAGFMAKISDRLPGQKTHGVEFDLGGIGKGYALEKAQVICSDWGIKRVLLHGGTSTALAVGDASSGNEGNTGWPVGIGGDWDCPKAPARFFLKNRALSGSGIEVKGEHIIDPKTWQPAKGHKAVWVSHTSAAWADALSTAFMVMTTEQVEEYCSQNPAVWAMVVKDAGKCKIYNRKAEIGK